MTKPKQRKRVTLTDKERLNWMNKNKAGVWWTAGVFTVANIDGDHYGLTLRQAIDAAMTASAHGKLGK